MSLNLPESVSDMAADPVLREGVNQLILKLNGKKMIADSREKRQKYSSALSMAAHARSDFVDLLHNLWEETWGRAGCDEFGQNEFDDLCTPHSIWEDNEIWDSYRLGASKTSKILNFYVCFDFADGARLEFEVYDSKWKPLDTTSLGIDVDGWEHYVADGWDHKTLKSKSVKLSELERNVEQLIKNASDLTQAIRNAQG